jgi:hypothetical protein
VCGHVPGRLANGLKLAFAHDADSGIRGDRRREIDDGTSEEIAPGPHAVQRLRSDADPRGVASRDAKDVRRDVLRRGDDDLLTSVDPDRAVNHRSSERPAVDVPREAEPEDVGDRGDDVDRLRGPSVLTPAPLPRVLDEERHERDVRDVLARDVRLKPPGRKLTPWSAVTITSARS